MVFVSGSRSWNLAHVKRNANSSPHAKGVYYVHGNDARFDESANPRVESECCIPSGNMPDANEQCLRKI